jgi:putative ABC transport system permease protein
MHIRFILREIWYSRGQAAIYVLCVALSLVSIVALSSFKRDIYSSLMSDARKLHGGDIILKSHRPFPPKLDSELKGLFSRNDITGIKTWEFYSVARAKDGEKSLLSNIKVVDNGYPLYGEVNLRSGRKIGSVLRPGKAVVAADLLERLDVRLGDSLLLGNSSVTIVDTIGGESQRPVDFFNFGPRIFVLASDLTKMGLVQHGSRVHFEVLLRLDNMESLEPIRARLHEISDGEVSVNTYATAESRVKRFIDNLLFFLSLISIFTLLLAGIGMQSGLAALLRRREKSMAVLKAVGASGKFLVSHYLALTLILSLIGCFLGIFSGLVVKNSLPLLFRGLLPGNISFGFSFFDLFEGVGLGLLVAAFFTYLPLVSILALKTAGILRQGKNSITPKAHSIFFMLCGAVFLFLLIIRQLEDFKIGLFFLGGFLGLILVITVVASIVIFLLSRLRGMPLALRQAVRSLTRPGNSTRSVVVTLAAALAVLLTIELIESDLYSTYISSYPEDAPNLFCLDIQKHQKQPFTQIIGGKVELFPVIRARLRAINGEKINRAKEKKRRGDSLSREFNLTYRGELLRDEVIIDGEALFGAWREPPKGGSNSALVPVSVLDSVAAIGDMRVGDILLFNIQGVPLEARISSIRSRTKSMLYPFFYYDFPPEILEPAPQTFFAALHLPVEEISSMENKIVSKFPNISTINVSLAAAELGRMMGKLSKIIDFFALFSICAGGLILVSSILATSMSRVREGVYYKIMGGGSRFVIKVFFLEHLLLALVGGLTAMLVAQLASWSLCHYIFDIEHHFNVFMSLYALLATAFLVVILGLISSIPIIRKKPATFLRHM